MEEVLERLKGLVGTEIGASDWMEITQERVDKFADATDDHQFIHVDPELAAQTPFGGTIAHGFLTLSLIVPLLMQVPLDVGYPVMGINYGLNKVRFPAPVPSGSRVSCRADLKSCEPKGDGRLLLTLACTVEVEGQDAPALVAEVLYLVVA